ncbi:DASH family cryptochrome [Thauera sp.]|jgi:deoxyribodipyrimidine photo-lyase|uniref:DASH family cryptochrome n=1 Tax=Thauera sp. TaxID=1905334 RepID=UPI002A36A125|nr:DASH family cryptochrome [Thauera sp.]MDX9886106.1 DASH family cryptochrome [Thauera sp.]
MSLNVVIYWFRSDLRLGDNAALHLACASAEGRCLLPVYCHDPAEEAATPWGFVRRGPHRRGFLAAALDDLDAQLRARGSRLLQLRGAPAEVVPALARSIGADSVVCEEIAAPEEQDAVAALRADGLTVRTVWQSSLLDPAALPFAVERLPKVFTDCRRAVEAAGQQPPAPLAAPAVLPPLPESMILRTRSLFEPAHSAPGWRGASGDPAVQTSTACGFPADERGVRHPYRGPGAHEPLRIGERARAHASFPWWQPDFAGGERAALAHLARYFAGDAAQRYKTTRNGLTGIDFSSKFSPWLAQGALSARVAFAALRRHEAERGANESTYWLWFELLWRDYFRFLHRQHGRRLYRARGLDERASLPAHDPEAFARWCAGCTGHAFIDAGMRELAATGWLSNRMRQIVASYLIHDLGCDWRAGAAWFEAQLVDYDVYSNQGNWSYLAGRGTDPRGGRRFDPDRQAAMYDADGAYRARWAEVDPRNGD